MSRWTFIAQRAVTKEFLHWDVPIEIDSVEWELSGPGSLSGTVSPDVGGLRADDGRLLLEEWGTLLYAEADGQIRWGGIVIQSTFAGENWSIEAAGFGTYPHSVIYEGEFSQIGVDPAAAFRLIWEHVQSFPDSDLGVSVVGDVTPVRLGTDAVPGWTEVFLDGVWQKKDAVPAARIVPDATANLAASMTLSDASLTVDAADAFAQVTPPFLVSIGKEDVLVQSVSGATLGGLVRGQNGTAATGHNTGTSVTFTGTKTREVSELDAEPYELLWWESTNCGAELDDLTKVAPFDWSESHRWSADREDVVHEVQIGYPRLGRRRDDLVFVQGDNVTNVVSVESNGDEFANTLLGLGAGEGRAMLRRSTGLRDGRLRRVATFSDKAINDPARLDALIADELNARKAALRITSVDVMEHPNAPIGSWQIGDDVLIRAELPWLGEIEMWVRITAWALTGDHTATLTVSRSDLFRYGG